jgi:hypothetical protein
VPKHVVVVVLAAVVVVVVIVVVIGYVACEPGHAINQ